MLNMFQLAERSIWTRLIYPRCAYTEAGGTCGAVGDHGTHDADGVLGCAQLVVEGLEGNEGGG